MGHRNMVFTSAGDNTRFDELWLGKQYTYDVYLIYFGDDTDVFEKYRSKVYFSERRKGSKFQNFYYFYKNYSYVFEIYDYIFILDDDICMTSQDIEQMFKIAKTYDLLICQPSFTEESQISHPITKHVAGVLLQYTNFVEVNTPLFKNEALIRLMDKYDESLIGWGIDYLSIYANGIELTNKYAIIHAVQCTNPTIENKKYQRKELNNIDNCQWREAIWEEFAYYHNYPSKYKLKVHSTLSKPTYTKWVINLDTRPDRWAKFKNMNANRWNATNGREITRDEALNDGVSSIMMRITNCSRLEYYTSFKIENNHGKIGCWLSHKKLLQHLLTLKYEDSYAHLILEDDVCLDQLSEWDNISNLVPSDWDIVYIGIKHPDLSQRIGCGIYRGVTSHECKKNYGTHAYFVKHGSIAGILQQLRFMTHEIDLQLNLLFETKKVYIIDPPIVTLSEDSSVSSIEDYNSYNVWSNYLLRIIRPPLDKLTFDTIPDLECFARMFAGMSPWLALDNENDIKLKILSKFDVLVYKDIFGEKQAIAECAYICYGFLLTKNIIWKQLSYETQLQFINILHKVRNLIKRWHKRYNWYLFYGMIEAFLKTATGKCDCNFVMDMIETVESWYCGDGFYKDGERGFTMDYYNSYVIHPFYIEILKVFKPDIVSEKFDRCVRYSEFLERIIGPDGTFPPLGRSIVYRFGAFHALAYCIYNQKISSQHTYSQLQRALTKVLNRIITDLVFDSNGMLQLGFTGNQPCIADDYSSWGSCYLTTLGFLPLGLDKGHNFWSDSVVDYYTQESAWKYNMSFKKYIIMHLTTAVAKPKSSDSVLFLLHGDKENYGLSLTGYLNSHVPTVFVDDDNIENINKNIHANKHVVVYTADSSIKKNLVANRIIEIYIGTREDVDCITILSYLERERIELSLNRFCLKCVQPRRVLLVSPGGSACTAFLQFLQNYEITINTPNSFTPGGDGLKHSLPDSHLVTAYDPTHVVYQYGDLDSSVRSLFRRNILDISYFYDNQQNFMNPLMRTTNKQIKFNTIQDYINEVLLTKEEPLGIIKHWKDWKSSGRNMYFVHYENIHKDKEIDNFLGLASNTCSAFTVKPRESKVLDIETPEYLSILRNIEVHERSA
jgi:hypothetical protein